MLTARRNINKYFINRGFTLIEMIVVLVIIAIVASIAVMEFSHFGDNQNLAAQAQLTSGVLKYARQNAIVNQDVFGVQFYDDGFSLVRLQDGKFIAWSPVESAHNHQRKVSYQFLTAAADSSNEQLIAFMPNGNAYGNTKLAPYKLILTLLDNGKKKIIQVTQNGIVTMQ
jgi:type II secretion system protein H